MRQAAGFGDGGDKIEDDSMGGDIMVTGDNHYHVETPKPDKPTTPIDKSWLPWALLASSIPASILAYQLPQLFFGDDKPTSNFKDTDTITTLRPDDQP